MIDPQEQNKNNDRQTGRVTLDIKIVGFIVGLAFFLFLLLGLLFLSGLAHVPIRDVRPALFGILSLVSDIQFGLYFFCIGIIGIFSAYGIVKKFKVAWWSLLILLIDRLLNGLLMLPDYIVSISIGSGLSVAIIIWLVYRRRLYGIGKTSHA